MGQAKQDKLNKEFVECLTSEKDIIDELCVCTPENKPYTRKFYCDERINYKLELLGMAMINYMENNTESCCDYLRELDLETKKNMEEHDCHLSQDSGCEICENSMRISEFIEKAFDIMYKNKQWN
jgi:hypothetical protein